MGHPNHIGYVTTEAYGQAVLFRIDRPEEIVSQIKALNAAKKDISVAGKWGDCPKCHNRSALHLATEICLGACTDKVHRRSA